MSVAHQATVVIVITTLAISAGVLVIARPQLGNALMVMATVLCGLGAVAAVLLR